MSFLQLEKVQTFKNDATSAAYIYFGLQIFEKIMQCQFTSPPPTRLVSGIKLTIGFQIAKKMTFNNRTSVRRQRAMINC